MKSKNSGSYQIYFTLPNEKIVSIGSLGEFKFPKGRYVYTGSAMKNLRQRVARHVGTKKTIKWHIDYLTCLDSTEIYKIEIFYSETREECTRNSEILNSGIATVPVKGFGSSDCRHCPSHLLFLGE